MSRIFAFIWLLIVSTFVSGVVRGQSYPMIHYTIDDGLPSNNVYNAYRDSKGYIWLATDKGIARYNGLKFEIFSTRNGLADNEVFFFKEDKVGRIWLATYNGRLCYYENGVFHNDANTPFLKMKFSISFIKTIEVEQDSSITITFMDKNKFINIYRDSIYAYDIHELDDNSLLYRLVTWEKIGVHTYRVKSCEKTLVVDPINGVRQIEQHAFKLDAGENIDYLSRVFCQNQEYIIGKLAIYDNGFNRLRKLDSDFFDNNLLYQIYHNRVGWFYGTSNGLIVNDSVRVLPGNKISCITEDPEGNYWITDLRKGVYMLPNDFFDTRQYPNAYDGTAFFAQSVKNRVFFTSYGNKLKTIVNDSIKAIYDFGSALKAKDMYAMQALYIDSSGRCVNGYTNGNTVIENVFERTLKVENYKTGIRRSGYIKNMVAVGDTLYINNGNTLLRLDYKQFKPTDSLVYRQINDPKVVSRIFKMAKAPDNSIWYCTAEHLYKIVAGTGIVQKAYDNSNLKSIWFMGKYLLAYNSQNQLMVFSNYDTSPKADTMPAQDCIWDNFCRLNDNHVLISTNSMHRLLTIDENAGSKKFKVSVIEHPLAPLQAESICADATNCYFFKQGTVTVLPIESLIRQPNPPKLFFTRLKSTKRTYAITSELTIPYHEARNLTVSFSTLDFAGSDIAYQYAISRNESHTWRDIAGEEISFINSDYGDFEISIRAHSLSSAYCEPVIFHLHILRPFWATWWFIALCIVLSLVIVGLAVRYRIAYVVRKREKDYTNEIKFMRSEYKALNALMNPHFIFNTLNNVQGLVNRNDKLAANEYLRVFADLIRQNMHNVSKEVITLHKEMELVRNYLRLEQLRFKERLNYVIEVDEDVDLTEIMVPPLLVQPLVENSIKHGIYPLDSVAGFINISIFERAGCLYIVVKDNGVGMNNAVKLTPEQGGHESFGLDNIRQRIKQLSILLNKEMKLEISEIRDDAGALQWTVVTIIMPVG